MAKGKTKVVEAEKSAETEEKVKGRVFTYVGGGEDSPRVITFMGVQKFVRGKAVTVTDPRLLAKLEGHPTFVEGEIDEEELHNYDEEEKAKADAQRKADEAVDAKFKKRHHGE